MTRVRVFYGDGRVILPTGLRPIPAGEAPPSDALQEPPAEDTAEVESVEDSAPEVEPENGEIEDGAQPEVIEEIGEPEETPAHPDDSWTLPQIFAWADENTITIPKGLNKPEILEHISQEG